MQSVADAQRLTPAPGQRPGAVIRAARGGAIPNHYLVKLREGFDPESIGVEAAVRGQGRLRHVYRHALRGFSVRLPEAAAEALARDPRVEYVIQDVEVTASALQASSPWNLDRIDQRPGTFDGGYTYLDDGTGVNVYVVDSGIRTTHRDFGGRASFVADFTDDDLDADPNDIGNDDSDPTTPDGADCNGHGTHVAGTIGGRTYGVAKNVHLWAYRVLRCPGAGQATDVVAALDAIIANHESPAIINLSLGSWGFTPLDDAVREAIRAGITVVVAAGNDGAAISSQTPARVSEAIVVGATDSSDQRTSYSNFGPLLDLFAPGDLVESSWFTGDTATAILSGTSMAAPLVSGAAALYLQTHRWASPAEVRDALVANATPDVVAGAGSGSPNRLLYAAFQAPATPQLRINPDAIDFPTVQVGTGSSRTVLLDNVGDAPLAINGVTLAGTSDFRLASDACSGTTVQAGQGCLLTVVFEPTGAGTRTATLSVTSTEHDSPRAAAVSGNGIYGNGLYVPPPWASADIGNTGVAGGATFADGAFTVRGAGADIWGSTDAFQFAYQPMNGDGTIVARVTNLAGSDPWTKAGVMIRDALQPDAAHALMLVSVGKGLAYQRRTASGGSTLNTSAGAGTAPAWLKLSRAGQVITASVSTDGTTWTVIGKNTFTMASTAYVGLAITSHSTTESGTARFDQVTVTATGSGANSLPSPWATSDVGSTGAAGSASRSDDVYTVKGAGADIWGSADAFRYAYRPLSGNGTITARVASLSGAQAWAKAGVMIRESLSPGSAHALMLVSVGKGIAFQRRVAANGVTTSTSGTGTAPKWVRLSRNGSVITASVSGDGSAWTVVGQDTFSMAQDVLVGLAVSSHDPSVVATATFDNVSEPGLAPGPALSPSWSSRDIGATGVAGSGAESSGIFTVKGGGADIWGSADAFQYVYRPLTGDGSLTARVTAINGTQAWVKAGVMIRESLTAGSAHALMLVSSAKGTAFQRRTATGGTTASTAGPAATAPEWVRVVRSGQTISAFVSNDGSAWTLVGQDTFAMGTSVYAGLAVSSHDPAALATAAFDNVH